MAFDFGKVAEVKVSNGASLEPNMIHDVKFVSAEMNNVDNKNGGAPYRVLDLNFEDEAGATYRHRFFEWDGQALQETNGQYGHNPARAAQDFALLQQLANAIGATITDKFNDWDDFRKKMVTSLMPMAGKRIRMKLIANNKGYATLPGFVLSYSKEDNLYTSTTVFVAEGGKLSFTPKEQRKIDAVKNATPTNIETPVFGVDGAIGGFTAEAKAVMPDTSNVGAASEFNW